MRISMLTSALFGLVLVPGWVQAQIKLPIYEEDAGTIQKASFQEATQRGDFVHGKLLRVTLNRDGEKTIKGTLVRVDRNTGRIYLRTEPGMPPVAISEKEIKRVDKGVIKEASFKQDIIVPEIRPIIIYNGKIRMTSYEAPALSSGERARLVALEAAENDMARLEQQVNRQNQVVETEIAIQAKQQRTLELLNDLLWKQPAQYSFSNSSYNNGILPILNTGSAQHNTLSGSTLFSSGISSLPFATGGSSLPLATLAPMTIARQVPVFPPSMVVNPELLTRARQNLLTAQGHVIYEGGFPVAVIANDQEMPKSN